MSILQGTTPKLEIKIPSDFPVNTIEKVELTFLHNGQKNIVDIDGVVLTAQTNTITYTFTETETLALDPKQPLWWQLRIKVPAGIVGTEKKQESVSDLISEAVLS